MAVVHAAAPEEAEELAEMLKQQVNRVELSTSKFTSVPGANTNPEFIGVV